jgi:predicted CoA-substrate-specific enzyme activase
MKKSLGICIGATTIKATLYQENHKPQSVSVIHHGNVPDAVKKAILDLAVDPGIPVTVTGTEGRKLINLESIIEAIAVESAVEGLNGHPDAIVSLGGEDFVVYTFKQGKISNTFSGDKCASGTGEFFRQQLLRMNMSLEDANASPTDAKICGLSTRCSVFMKSDCTHRLNKGEATKEDIVVSLVHVMATKISEFLTKARISKGKVWLIGGVTRNTHLIPQLKKLMKKVEFFIPENADTFESFGASLIAAKSGTPLPKLDKLFKKNRITFEKYPHLKHAAHKVHFMKSHHAKPRQGRDYVLGVDGGSTTTKVALIDKETLDVSASHYGRTHGNPVEALRECIREVIKQVKEATGETDVRITLAATTGSSRELLGTYLATPGVYNEIIAHARATAHYDKEIDTIFEIGGQDAKYVYLRNGVPIDYAMNEACSAGTGSFLEESAHSDLNINHPAEIGPVAMEAEFSLKFGEHCSAFINSDIRKAAQQGASREAIVGGLVHSIVSNYLNRVVGNRRIGKKVALQGGVAKNPAVPLAFASILGKDIVVPPSPELLGCLGVAFLAIDKNREGLLPEMDLGLQKVLDTAFEVESEFKCKSCENDCPIKVIKVSGKKSFFGGRCNKYTNIRKNIDIEKMKAVDYVQLREEMMLKLYSPTAEELTRKKGPRIGIPMALTSYTLWPLVSTFFHELGVQVVMSDRILKSGIQHCESSFCYPAEIAHGAMADLIEKGCDYYFLPQVKMLPTHTDEVHAMLCPITQGLPYYLRTAFELNEKNLLRPVIRMEHDLEEGEAVFIETAKKIGKSASEGRKAFRKGILQFRAFQDALRKKGKEILDDLEKEGRTAIVLLGRPYNAFTADANMEVPRKLQTRGYTVIPFDFLPVESMGGTPNMYWYFGQMDVGVANYVKNHPNLFMTYVSNFSCAPDSFLLHIMHWTMGIKPFLVLEIDSHTADAGVDTRIEAFIDIIEGFRRNESSLVESTYQRRWDVVFKGETTVVRNNATGKELNLKDPKVNVIWPSMGRYASEGMAAISQSLGINASCLPVADDKTTQLARNVASGKECIPTLLVLGSTLQYLEKVRPDDDKVYVVLVPKTTGPCRTGQYAYFYERTFHQLGLENVACMILSADNSYLELGPSFSFAALRAIIASDLFRDMQNSLRVLAVDKEKALLELESAWQDTLELFKSGKWRNPKEFEKIGDKIAKIPLKKSLAEVEKVMIVGEIYVRRDDFSVEQLIENLSERGIVGKIGSVMEWFLYTDFVRKSELQRKLKLLPFWKRPFSVEYRKLLRWELENWYKHKIEHQMMHAFGKTGLIPDAPTDMEIVMRHAKNFTDPQFNSETTCSTCVAIEAIEKHGYSGIVAIAPFACLIGRVIKSLLGPYMRKQDIPFIALENDGFQYSAALLSRLEVFMLSVLRHSKKKKIDPAKAVAEKGRAA